MSEISALEAHPAPTQVPGAFDPAEMTESEKRLRHLRETARPLVLQVPGLPLGIWGSCFAAAYRKRVFVVTAAHLSKRNLSEHVRVAAANDLRRSFQLGRGVMISPPGDPDGVDVIVYPSGLGGFDEATLVAARLIDLESSVSAWQGAAYASDFLVVGFPRDLNEVDYERSVVKAAQVMLLGQYDGVVRVDSHIHRLRVSNPHELSQFAGFSGGPVFSVEQQVAAEPLMRFCGVAIMGSASSNLIHFVDADAVKFVLDTAIDHLNGKPLFRGPPPEDL